MIIAIDTDFLVAVEIRDHLFHKPADTLLGRLLEEGHKIGRCAANAGGIRSCGYGFETVEGAPIDGGGLGQSRTLVASP